MFFRNLTLFRFHADVAADLDSLPDVLPEHRLRPCGALEMGTRGFVPVTGRGDDAPLTHDAGNCTLFAVGAEDKLLPAAVLNEALARKVQKIAEDEDRKVGGRERKRIKEDLLSELLPRAFSVTSRSMGYVDTANHWLVLDTSSRKAAESMITQLREALGSFPAMPLAPEEGPRVLMTDWLATGKLPAGFALGDECELRDPATSDGAIVRATRQDMDAEEVKEHLRNGKQVFKLGLVFDDRMSFVLGEDLVIRKLRFLDGVVDQLADCDDAASEFAVSATLMTLELQRLFARLDDIFKLSPDAPLHLHGQAAPVGMRRAAQAASRLDSMLREDGDTATLEVPGGGVVATFGDGPDPIYASVVETVRSSGKASIAMVQRLHRIGYNRAARLIEEMEKDGIVSTPADNGARPVLQPSPS